LFIFEAPRTPRGFFGCTDTMPREMAQQVAGLIGYAGDVPARRDGASIPFGYRSVFSLPASYVGINVDRAYMETGRAEAQRRSGGGS
jgi:hypothetical protein